MSEKVAQIKITINNSDVINKSRIIEALESSLARYKEESGQVLCARELVSSVFGKHYSIVCVRQEGHLGDHKGEVFWDA